MAITPAARDELEILRILDEGKLAEKFWILPEQLRRYNVSMAEYTSLRKRFVIPNMPIPFDSKETALAFVFGNYKNCQLKLGDHGGLHVESVVVEEIEPSHQEPIVAAKRRFLTDEDAEAIANELMEQSKSVGAIAKDYGTTVSTVYTIKNGSHSKLSEKTRDELVAMFDVAADFARRNRKKKKKTKEKKVAVAPKGKKKSKKQKRIAPIPGSRAMLTVEEAPSRHPVRRAQSNRDLLIEELRETMKHEDIETISIRANGEIAILRKEIYKLEAVR